jgi:hypothetical protein
VSHYDPALLKGLTDPTSDLTTISKIGYKSSRLTFDALCSDACLQDPACFKSAWGNVLPAFTQSVATKEAALEWVDANPGRTLALVAFESGVEGSAEPASEIIKYMLGRDSGQSNPPLTENIISGGVFLSHATIEPTKRRLCTSS